MAKLAVIQTGGKQYKISEGQILKVEKLNLKPGEKIRFETLLSYDGKDLNLGKPSLADKAEGKIIEHGKGKKVAVIKYKRKTRYKKNVGHRQPFTKVEITNIAI